MHTALFHGSHSPFCCQAIEQLLGTSSPEMEGLLTGRAGFDYFAGDQ